MAKVDETRFEQSLASVPVLLGNPTKGNEIVTAVKIWLDEHGFEEGSPNRAALGAALSLGGFRGGINLFKSNAETELRHCRRAVLLAQRSIGGKDDAQTRQLAAQYKDFQKPQLKTTLEGLYQQWKDARRPLYVALLKENTQANQMKDTVRRQDLLREAVIKTQQALDQCPDINKAKGGHAAYCLFVAPEYFFAKPTPGGQADQEMGMVRQLDEEAKVRIEVFIQKLSKAHPGMILVPGSVAWKKSLARDLETYLRHKRLLKPESVPAEVAEVGALLRYQLKAPRLQKAVQTVQQQKVNAQAGYKAAPGGVRCDQGPYCASCNGYRGHNLASKCSFCTGNLVMRPGDWFYCNGCRQFTRAVAAGETQCGFCGQMLGRLGLSKPETLALLNDPKAQEMSRNTAYVYLDGRRYLKYHKQAGFHEVLSQGDRNVFVPGKKQPTACVDNLWFGVEICFDHAAGALKTPADGILCKPADVHVILSACVMNQDANLYTRVGGWVVHASSNFAYNRVAQRTAGGWKGSTPFIPPGGAVPNVDLYRIWL
jgi:hypothetical protein